MIDTSQMTKQQLAGAISKLRLPANKKSFCPNPDCIWLNKWDGFCSYAGQCENMNAGKGDSFGNSK